MDYLVLVNKDHPLPEGWEEKLKTITVTNSIGDQIDIEKKTGEAYQRLKASLEEEGIYIDIDSAYRSVEDQRELKERFLEKYGEEYTAKTVAEPGFSEHHTGLAVDLYFRLKEENETFTDIVENEDLVRYPEIWEKIHQKLPEFGFILRFTKHYEDLTGDSYEPWHIRYVDSPEIAKEMTEKDLTLEEYLNKS
ncbi:MAG: M15 family metallopeptidase [Firmicutes bacterium]|nr:M15 family metallopeptidase [Bacillota bacterium]